MGRPIAFLIRPFGTEERRTMTRSRKTSALPRPGRASLRILANSATIGLTITTVSAYAEPRQMLNSETRISFAFAGVAA